LFALVNIVLNAEDARRRLTARIEEYLDNTVSRIVAKDKETEYNMMNRILKETFAEFGKRIEKSLKQTADAFDKSLPPWQWKWISLQKLWITRWTNLTGYFRICRKHKGI